MVQGMDTVEGYFPQGVWYNISEVEAVDASTAGRRVRIAAPLETVPVHVLGGSIIPLQVCLLKPCLKCTGVEKDSHMPACILCCLKDTSQP